MLRDEQIHKNNNNQKPTLIITLIHNYGTHLSIFFGFLSRGPTSPRLGRLAAGRWWCQAIKGRGVVQPVTDEVVGHAQGQGVVAAPANDGRLLRGLLFEQGGCAVHCPAPKTRTQHTTHETKAHTNNKRRP